VWSVYCFVITLKGQLALYQYHENTGYKTFLAFSHFTKGFTENKPFLFLLNITVPKLRRSVVGSGLRLMWEYYMPCKEQRTSNPMVILLTAEIVNYYGV